MTRSPLVIVGVIIAVLGIVGLAVPIFTTEQTRDVAKVGDLKLQTTDRQTFVVPPLVSGGALLLGVILVGAGMYRRP